MNGPQYNVTAVVLKLLCLNINCLGGKVVRLCDYSLPLHAVFSGHNSPLSHSQSYGDYRSDVSSCGSPWYCARNNWEPGLKVTYNTILFVLPFETLLLFVFSLLRWRKMFSAHCYQLGGAG